MPIHPAVTDLLAEIESFRHRTGISVCAFGTRATNDPGLIPDLKNGRQPSFSTIDRIRNFMGEASCSQQQS